MAIIAKSSATPHLPLVDLMDVITTHINADFDCLGAMVAAKKIYPDAMMVFSGSQEKSMRDFFLKSTGYAFNFTRLKDIDLNAVTRLILVDCQHASRIGRFKEILTKPGLEIHIYDHHPDTAGNIVAQGGEVRPSGSSTTILTSLLRQRGITVSPIEATLMMLGIYEDTGSLTFPTTTVEDFQAAAWLLEQGAHLNTVADFITQELTAEQVSLLNDLLKSLKTTSLNGVDISIAQAAVDYYIGDIAVLAHMMRDMEGLEALFLVVGMGNRVCLVARSRLPEVPVGEILREFGGGGHATAASATVKDLTVIQVLEKLDQVLRRKVNPQRLAGDIMSSPVKTLPAATSIAAARDLLTRYNVNAMPVLDDERMVGIISRRIVEKAIYHSLGQLPVTEYMHTEFMRAAPDTPIAAIKDYCLAQNQRLVPVFADEELVGVVTRTDLLRYMYSGDTLYDLARESTPVRSKEIVRQMRNSLSPRILEVLRELGAVGEELSLPVYAVGGFVRDLLLGQENLDIDVTVEGDGITFAEIFAARYGSRVKSHQKFGTAVIVFPDGLKVDVASTRFEYYDSPGALPTVERSSLKMDLYRRDFTINTLAIRLNASDFGLLVDYFGAQRDLRERTIKVLHNLSFVEDPTRVFRAVRFEQRLGFHISAHSESLIKNAVKMNFLDKLGGKRLLSELIHIFNEREPHRAVERMASLGLFRFIHPELSLGQEERLLLDETSKIVSWYDLLFLEKAYARWVVYFLAISCKLDDDQFLGVCTRLAVSEHYRQQLSEHRHRALQTLDVMEKRLGIARQPVRPDEIYHWLVELPVEVLLHMMARTRHETVKKQLSLFFTKLRTEHCLINGHDLLELGVMPGPAIGQLLDQVLSARLNGELHSREDELDYVKRLLPDV
jgi:tRNA nucleotidyltransferase (CCA-adding enzyme)